MARTKQTARKNAGVCPIRSGLPLATRAPQALPLTTPGGKAPRKDMNKPTKAKRKGEYKRGSCIVPLIKAVVLMKFLF